MTIINPFGIIAVGRLGGHFRAVCPENFEERPISVKTVMEFHSGAAPQIIKTKKLKLKRQEHIIHHFNP